MPINFIFFFEIALSWRKWSKFAMVKQRLSWNSLNFSYACISQSTSVACMFLLISWPYRYWSLTTCVVSMYFRCLQIYLHQIHEGHGSALSLTSTSSTSRKTSANILHSLVSGETDIALWEMWAPAVQAPAPSAVAIHPSWCQPSEPSQNHSVIEVVRDLQRA